MLENNTETNRETYTQARRKVKNMFTRKKRSETEQMLQAIKARYRNEKYKVSTKKLRKLKEH